MEKEDLKIKCLELAAATAQFRDQLEEAKLFYAWVTEKYVPVVQKTNET